MKNKYLITVDGGTTNTRAALWNLKKELQYAVKSQVGVKDTAQEGSNERLKDTVRYLIEALMEHCCIAYDEVETVYACGMLTSDVGIHEVPHLAAPLGKEDFAAGIEEVLLPEICPVPICFIPGMKNLSGEIHMDHLEMMDVMRGEEMETIALMDLYKEGEALYVLPGSHTKFVSVDRNQRITGCLTSMAGELLAVLTNYSILANAVKKQYASAKYHRDMLILGAEKTWDTTLPRAAFLTRIVNGFITDDQEACASFLLGAVLADDISTVKKSAALAVTEKTSVVIAGKEPLRSALKELFLRDGTFKEVTAFERGEDFLLSGYGMCVTAELREKR